MYRIFSQINLLSLVLFPSLIILYILLHSTFQKGLYTFESNNIAYLGVWGSAPISSFLNIILCGTFVFVNATVLNWVFNKLNFYERSTLLPGFIYVILLTNTREFSVFDGALIFHLLIILTLYLLSRITINKQHSEVLFNMGFLLGIGASFFPVFYFAFPVFYIVSLLLKTYKLRELTAYLAGWILPQIFVAFYLFIFKIPFLNSVESWPNNIPLIPLNYFFDTIILLFTFLIVITTVTSVVSTLSLHLRRYTFTIVVLAIMSVAVATHFYLFFGDIRIIHMVTIPLAILFAIVLLKKKNKFLQFIAFYSVFIFSFLKFFFT